MKTMNKRIKEGIERANREIADGVIYEAALQRQLAARKAKAAQRWWFVVYAASLFGAAHVLVVDIIPWWRVIVGGTLLWVACATFGEAWPSKPKGGRS